ncbi:AsmA family protein [Desulfohalovibrio reitneri]|uniref:DUF748 domain-containing protein n=1 Tax=Desulfohalovibrio reitneri TaxID=1307759 RepID=UPI0004A6F90D|nr:AsmA family protein [Desulfohalovibrio reitneri]
MKKILAVIAVIVVAAVLVLYFQLNTIVERGVETVGSKTLKTAVALDGASLSLFSGSGEINGLTVANPEGFSDKSAIRLGSAAVGVDIGSILSDTIIVEQVRITDPAILLETGDQGSNLDRLLQNAKSAAPSGGQQTGEQQQSGKKVIIRDLRITGAQATLALRALGERSATVNLPEIHLTNIGEDKGGASPAEVLSQIMAAVQKSVTSAASNAGEAVQEALEKGAQQFQEGTQKQLEEGSKGIKESLEGLMQ